MTAYVEHANISVRNLDKSIDFFRNALPEFGIRRRFTIDESEWAHVGTDTSYVALVQDLERSNADDSNDGPRYSMENIGFNHIGFVVDDVDAVVHRLREGGYRGGYNAGEVIETPYRRSVYFLDSDGNEFEFMQYLTDDIDARNTYDV